MSIEQILERKGQKDAARKERKAEREDAGIVTALIVDRAPDGLHSCRYPRGNIPDELKGCFTSKLRILEIAKRRGIPVGE